MKPLILAAIVAAATSLSAAASGLMAMNPFAFETTKVAKTGAAYIPVMSQGAADRLIGAASSAAKRVEIHTHIKGDNGVMKMRQVDGPLPVTEDAPLKMAPGGVHVMLMGLNAPLTAGDTVPVTLVFEAAGKIVVEVPVVARESRAESGGHSGHSGHSNHSDHSNASD